MVYIRFCTCTRIDRRTHFNFTSSRFGVRNRNLTRTAFYACSLNGIFPRVKWTHVCTRETSSDGFEQLFEHWRRIEQGCMLRFRGENRVKVVRSGVKFKKKIDFFFFFAYSRKIYSFKNTSLEPYAWILKINEVMAIWRTRRPAWLLPQC